MTGFALCGSYCTHSASLKQMEQLIARGVEILPVMSENTYNTDTRFGKCRDLIERVETLTGNKIIQNTVEAEPLGPAINLDALIICPCTGNTLAKLANGISDTSVSMAAKAHLRSNRPLIIALASNDALSANLKNIAAMLSRKHVYFVPMTQDDPDKKPHSLVADFSLLQTTIEFALKGKQIQKLFI